MNAVLLFSERALTLDGLAMYLRQSPTLASQYQTEDCPVMAKAML